MDPRHPEQAISRMRELMQQYDRIENDMKTAVVSAQLGSLEREASLVIQEICLVAPRLHEAMMQTSRERRKEINRTVVVEEPILPDLSKKEVPYEMKEVTPEAVEEYVEDLKPKKKTTKKKKAKKVE